MTESPLFSFDIQNSKKWRGVVIHHSATVDGVTNDWESIRKFHKSHRYNGNIIDEKTANELIMSEAENKGVLMPWSDIGYHFGVENEDDKVKIKIGRSLALAGAHAKEFNVTHIGLCVIGNFDEEPPSNEKWQSALALIRSLMRFFPFTVKEILGHRETYPIRGVPVEKTCPGRKWDMNEFRAQI